MAALRALLRHSARPVPSPSHAGRRGSKNLDWFIAAVARGEEAKAAAPTAVMPAETLHGRKRARAFIDFAVGRPVAPAAPGADAATVAAAPPPPVVSRVVVELADDIVPRTVDNFLQLCARPSGSGYVGCEVFAVRKGVGLLTGDWQRGDGSGSVAAVPDARLPGGRHFADENFIVRHAAAGVLTMANSGSHTNGSVFAITAAPLPHLDGRNVAFGRVLTGLDAVQRIVAAFAVNFKPATPIVITAAGLLPEGDWAAVDKAVATAAAAAAAATKKADATATAAAAKKAEAGGKPAGGKAQA